MGVQVEFDLQEAVTLYLGEGRTTTEIGAKLGVSPATVGRRLQKAGVQLRARGVRPLGAAVAQDVVSLYESGKLTIPQVAARVGISPFTVSSMLSEASATRGNRSFVEARHGAVIRDLQKAGLLQHEIAAKVGLSRSTVGRYLRNLKAKEQRGVRSEEQQGCALKAMDE